MSDKQCLVNLQGTIDCTGEGQRDKSCCCLLLGWATLECDAEPDDFITALQSLPPYSQPKILANFGNDGWVLVYNYPRPGDCEDTTPPDPGTGG